MNYFAHARPFLDDPYFAAGTAVPDWLAVVDRSTRVRAKDTLPFLEAEDPITAAVARGLLQHLRDDRHFHRTRAFVETSLELSERFVAWFPARRASGRRSSAICWPRCCWTACW